MGTNNNNLFIYHLTLSLKYRDPSNWTDDTHRIIREHADFIKELGEKGTLIFAGRTALNPEDDHLFGIAIIKAESLQKAIHIMSEDPAVLNNIQKSSVFPFTLAFQFFKNLE